LVAVSVGVFLLITITAAIVILTPKAGVEGTAFSSSHPYPAGRLQAGTENIRDAQPQSEISQDAGIGVNKEESNVVTVADRNDGDRLTISIPKPSTAAVPDNQDIPATAVSRPAAAVTPARTAATATTTTTPKPAAATAPAPAAARPAAVARTAPAPAKTINDFWVQTGAFSAQVRAEDAKETLASKGITSIVDNRIIEGKVWYRVRLGPYTSEREANYWLALVKTIDGFGESQVRQTVRQQ